jgi:hypothetical protein
MNHGGRPLVGRELEIGGRGFLGAALLDFADGLAEALGFDAGQRVLCGSAIAAEVDGVENDEGAADSPHEAEDESEECGGTEVGDGALPFLRSGLAIAGAKQLAEKLRRAVL